MDLGLPRSGGTRKKVSSWWLHWLGHGGKWIGTNLSIAADRASWWCFGEMDPGGHELLFLCSPFSCLESSASTAPLSSIPLGQSLTSSLGDDKLSVKIKILF